MRKRFIQGLLFVTLVSISAGSLAIARAEDAKVPVTAQDHLDLAKLYEERAATYRKEVEFHKKMHASYEKQAVTLPKTGPNPWVTKMKKHCQMLIKDAEKLATDADKAAEFHKLRAKEVEGK